MRSGSSLRIIRDHFPKGDMMVRGSEMTLSANRDRQCDQDGRYAENFPKFDQAFL